MILQFYGAKQNHIKNTLFEIHIRPTSMTITFVTAFFNIYANPVHNRDVEWRFQHFRKLAETGIQLAVICSPDDSVYFENILIQYPNVRVIQYIYLQDTWTFRVCDEIEKEIGEPMKLPATRNPDKDTREYILLMNSKAEFLKIAVDKNPWGSTHFAWIDFNIFHVFKKEAYVKLFLSTLAKRTLAPSFLTLPGCWGREYYHEPYLLNDIQWRFCGGFFVGSADRIRGFYQCHKENFPTFLREKRHLVWEVNMWSYYENTYGLQFHWYKGDHNESILDINARHMSKRLADAPSCRHIKYTYPQIESYIPTSTSFIVHHGRGVLNTRFVNYFIQPDGSYLIRDDNGYLRTRNFCSVLSNEDTTCMPDFFREMHDPDASALVSHGGNIYGLEDIRLYELRGELRFVATSVNYSGVGKSRIVIGKYNIPWSDEQRGEYSDFRVLVPPEGNDWYEKNWIPIQPIGSAENPGDEFFIYKWFPFEIGVIRPENNQLEIVQRWEHHTPMFAHVRGSSIFMECEEGRLGVVHFSYEGHPRNYYHMLVLLDKVTGLPLKYSEYFYFNDITIEFCIGFMVYNNVYHFWISNFDRDPELITVNVDELPLLYTFE
jgi:hypothetical protein